MVGAINAWSLVDVLKVCPLLDQALFFNFSMKLLLYTILISLKLTTVLGQTTQKLVVYKKFAHAGTTMMLVGAFNKPSSYNLGIDTTNINTSPIISTQEWNGLLARSRVKKHHQMKIGGVDWAGEMYLQKERHFFIMCYPYVIMDLTARKNYWLAEGDKHVFDERLSQLKDR
jgi:hypothetical protein